MFDFVEGVIRWHNRVVGYAFILVTDRYPPFSLGQGETSPPASEQDVAASDMKTHRVPSGPSPTHVGGQSLGGEDPHHFGRDEDPATATRHELRLLGC